MNLNSSTRGRGRGGRGGASGGIGPTNRLKRQTQMCQDVLGQSGNETLIYVSYGESVTCMNDEANLEEASKKC